MPKLNIASNIAKLRKRKGLTQTALAEIIYVSNKTVSKWERGVGYPEITQLLSLAKVLETTVDDLLSDERYGITVAGNILTDYVKIIDAYPEKGMLSNIHSISQAVGGCVPNTAIDLAVIDPSLNVSAVGMAGNDAGGRYAIQEMKNKGIDTSGVVITDKYSTGFSDVMSIKSTGERTFFHHKGANKYFSPNDINIDSLCCKLFHIGYILLLDSFDKADSEYGTVMARFLHDLQNAGIRTSIDVVSDSTGSFAEKVIPALKYTSNAIMNEIEACSVCGIPPRDENGKLIVRNIRTAMEQILAHGVSERVIIHCPEAGFILNSEKVFTCVPSLVARPGYIKGTVGAGDAFCAGSLYGIYNNYSDEQILEFASGAAMCNLSAQDSVSGMRSKEYIEKLIEQSQKNTL